ncbi:hypothetical protein ACHAXS_009412 [Conticribra weissflogii]
MTTLPFIGTSSGAAPRVRSRKPWMSIPLAVRMTSRVSCIILTMASWIRRGEMRPSVRSMHWGRMWAWGRGCV